MSIAFILNPKYFPFREPTPILMKNYIKRYSIERTNAWMDSFRSLLNRFDTTLSSWIGFNYLAFITIACKKFKKSR